MPERASLKYNSYYWDDSRKILYRANLESKHILWAGRFKGTAAFNKEILDQYKDKALTIGFKYKDVKYTTTPEMFYKFGEILNYKEPQMALEMFFWGIEL